MAIGRVYKKKREAERGRHQTEGPAAELKRFNNEYLHSQPTRLEEIRDNKKMED